MSLKVDLTYKTKEKGIIDKKTFFNTTKKREEDKTDEMEFCRSDFFSVD